MHRSAATFCTRHVVWVLVVHLPAPPRWEARGWGLGLPMPFGQVDARTGETTLQGIRKAGTDAARQATLKEGQVTACDRVIEIVTNRFGVLVSGPGVQSAVKKYLFLRLISPCSWMRDTFRMC